MSHRLERLALQRGVRMSAQRLAILQVLDSTPDALSAPEILLRSLELNQHVSLSTVHRTLKLLTKFRLLTQLGSNHPVRYMRRPPEHREHLIDLQTGGVVEFRSDGIEALLEHSVNQLGYRLLDYRLELFGTLTCPTEDEPAPANSSEAGGVSPPRPARQRRH